MSAKPSTSGASASGLTETNVLKRKSLQLRLDTGKYEIINSLDELKAILGDPIPSVTVDAEHTRLTDNNENLDIVYKSQVRRIEHLKQSRVKVLEFLDETFEDQVAWKPNSKGKSNPMEPTGEIERVTKYYYFKDENNGNYTGEYFQFLWVSCNIPVNRKAEYYYDFFFKNWFTSQDIKIVRALLETVNPELKKEFADDDADDHVSKSKKGSKKQCTLKARSRKSSQIASSAGADGSMPSTSRALAPSRPVEANQQQMEVDVVVAEPAAINNAQVGIDEQPMNDIHMGENIETEVVYDLQALSQSAEADDEEPNGFVANHQIPLRFPASYSVEDLARANVANLLEVNEDPAYGFAQANAQEAADLGIGDGVADDEDNVDGPINEMDHGLILVRDEDGLLQEFQLNGPINELGFAAILVLGPLGVIHQLHFVDHFMNGN